VVLCFLYVIVLSGARSGLERGDLPLALGLWWVHGVFLFITWLAWQLESMGAFFSRWLPVRSN
jgi:lipopolysaccharide export LptBFGC system permease protein LptF